MLSESYSDVDDVGATTIYIVEFLKEQNVPENGSSST